MSERETHNLMSVEAFSQLPFIRPSPPMDNPSKPNSGLRLFGFDFPPDPNSHPLEAKPIATENSSSSNTTNSVESGRKFECHYCCRNFPTSQALGGHQNAHKRERQHAKRAHLQSVAMAAHHHHPSDGHVYSLLNYHRLPSSTAHVPPPRYYPLWNTTSSGSNSAGGRYYGGLGSVSHPINGSPLPGLWRVPGGSFGIVHHERSMATPLFGGGGGGGGGGGDGGRGVGPSSLSSSSSTTMQGPKAYGSGAKDSVSLDLHL